MPRPLWISICLALLGTLALAALVALDYGWQREWLRGQLESQLSSALGKPVALARLDGVLHRGLRADGVRIGEAEAPLVEDLALELDFRWFVWNGRTLPSVGRLHVSGGRVHLRRTPEGAWPGSARPAAPEAPATELPFPLRIAEVHVDGVEIALRDGQVQLAQVAIEGEIRDVRLTHELHVARAELAFAVRGGERAEQRWAEGTATGRFRAGKWELDALALEGPVFTLDARGRGDTERLGVAHVLLRVPELAPLAPLLPGELSQLAGSFDASARLAGPWSWPLGSARLDARGLSLGEVALGDLHVAVRSEAPGSLVIEGLEARGGPVELVAAPGARLHADAGRAAIEGLELSQGPAAGSLRVDASFSPDAAGEQAPGDVRVAVRSRDWRLGAMAPLWALLGVGVEGTLDADIAWRSGAAGGTLDASGSLTAGRIANARYASQDLAARFDVGGSVRRPSGRVEFETQLEGDGAALGALALATTFSEGTFDLERFAWDRSGVELVAEPGARVTLVDGGGRVDGLVLVRGEQRLRVDGTLVATEVRSARVGIEAIDVQAVVSDLAALGLVDDGSLALSGVLNGELAMDGVVTQPTVSGSLAWSAPRVGALDFDRIALELANEGPVLRVTTEWQRQGARVLDAFAELPRERLYAQPASLLADARTRARLDAAGFDLAALAPLLGAALPPLGGRLDAKLTLRGDAGTPSVAGRVEISDGFVAPAALAGERLAPIELELDFSGSDAVLERLRIGEDGASLGGRGTFSLSEGRPERFDLTLAFERFPLDARGLVRGVLDGSLHLVGTPTEPSLDGELELSALRIRIPDEQDTTLREIRVVTSDAKHTGLSFEEQPDADDLLDPFRVDVALDVARNSWARGRGADVELRGAMRAIKAPNAPLRLSGELETVRGTYKAYGRRFRIERGRALLDGGDEPDPVLDVRAVYRVRDVRITAIVEGRLSEMRLRFESEPSLTETDIASYLLFGRPASGGTAGQDVALEAAAAGMAAGVVMREFEQFLGGDLPVDVADLSVEDNDGRAEVRAGVGAYVGDRLFLHYERGFGSKAEDEVRAEYELTPNWSVESTISPSGKNTGGDVIFELEY